MTDLASLGYVFPSWLQLHSEEEQAFWLAAHNQAIKEEKDFPALTANIKLRERRKETIDENLCSK